MRPLARVVVGVDGSPEARAALVWAASLCAVLHASLRVVHVVGLLEEAHLTPSSSSVEVQARSLASEAGLPPDRVEWRLIDGSPADALLRLSSHRRDVDLLVVGTRGAGRKAGTILGSTSLELAERATVPLVIVPSEGGAQQG
jgi:nucleotide-binding universal stress UspA family protein